MDQPTIRTATDKLRADLISRRRLMRFAALGMGSIAAGGLASACAGSSPSDRQPASRAGREEQQTVRLSMFSEFTGLDPAATPAQATLGLCDYIYEQLYRWDRFQPDQAPHPELASEMPRELSPTLYQFGLREDALFHDGTPVTADDVVFSIQRLRGSDQSTAFRKQFMTMIAGVRAVDEYLVEVELTAPSILLADRLALVHVLSRTAVEGSDAAREMQPVGSGPYRVVTATSGEHITLERFSEYAGLVDPGYETLEFTVVADANARLSGLLAGDSDVVEEVPFSAYDGLRGTSGYNIEAVPGDERSFLWFNCSRAPFVDARARRAILYAIDRDRITESIYFGMASPAWTGQIRDSDTYYATPDTIYEFSPSTARQLLDAAGVSANATPIDIVLPSDTEHVWLQGPIIEANLREIGFEPNIVPANSTGVIERLVSGDFHIAMLTGTTTNLSPTAELYLRLQYSADLPRTLTHWDTPELARVEQLLEEAQFAQDDVAFRSALAEVQNIVQEQVPFSSLHWFDHISAWSETVSNFRPLPLRGLFRDALLPE